MLIAFHLHSILHYQYPLITQGLRDAHKKIVKDQQSFGLMLRLDRTTQRYFFIT